MTRSSPPWPDLVPNCSVGPTLVCFAFFIFRATRGSGFFLWACLRERWSRHRFTVSRDEADNGKRQGGNFDRAAERRRLTDYRWCHSQMISGNERVLRAVCIIMSASVSRLSRGFSGAVAGQEPRFWWIWIPDDLGYIVPNQQAVKPNGKRTEVIRKCVGRATANEWLMGSSKSNHTFLLFLFSLDLFLEISAVNDANRFHHMTVKMVLVQFSLIIMFLFHSAHWVAWWGWGGCLGKLPALLWFFFSFPRYPS